MSSYRIFEDFPGGSDGKSICLQCWRPRFNSWARKISWRRKWQPTPVLLPGKSHGWMEEPARLQSMGLQTVRLDWANSLSFFSFFIGYSVQTLKLWGWWTNKSLPPSLCLCLSPSFPLLSVSLSPFLPVSVCLSPTPLLSVSLSPFLPVSVCLSVLPSLSSPFSPCSSLLSVSLSISLPFSPISQKPATRLVQETSQPVRNHSSPEASWPGFQHEKGRRLFVLGRIVRSGLPEVTRQGSEAHGRGRAPWASLSALQLPGRVPSFMGRPPQAQPWIVYLHSRNRSWKMKTKTSRNSDDRGLGVKADSGVISQAGFQRGFHPNTKYFWEQTLPFVNAVLRNTTLIQP